jgi:hypothetical protein
MAAIQVGLMYGDEQIVSVSERDNVFITQSFNRVSQRNELNFYRLDSKAHWYTKAL